MPLVDVRADEFPEPVGVDASKRIEHAGSLGDHLVQPGVVGIVFAVVVGAVTVSRSGGILQQPFEFEFLVALHHLHAAAATQRHADAEVVVHLQDAVGVAALRGDFNDTVCSLHSVEGTGHGIFEDLDLLNVGRIERQEGIRRDDLSIHDIEGFVGRISGPERRIPAQTDLWFGAQIPRIGYDEARNGSLQGKRHVDHRFVVQPFHVYALYDARSGADVDFIDVAAGDHDHFTHIGGILLHGGILDLLSGILYGYLLHADEGEEHDVPQGPFSAQRIMSAGVGNGTLHGAFDADGGSGKSLSVVVGDSSAQLAMLLDSFFLSPATHAWQH